MNRTTGNAPIAALIIIALLGLGFIGFKFCAYTINEWEQAVITRFGEVIGEPVDQAGLHFKMPWYQVARFDKRLLRWDGRQTTTITRDRRTINIDVTARWRIQDARLFRETIRSVSQADSRLNGIIEGAIKDEIAKFDLYEVVRSSNRILDFKDVSTNVATGDGDMTVAADNLATLGSDLPRLATSGPNVYTVGRPIILQNILVEARRRIEQIGLGIHLEDVLVKQLGYIREIESNVYAQMNAELMKIAAGFRSSGQQRAEQRLGEMERELSIIESSAVERAQRIRGEAEAEAIRVYAEAYNADPAFYQLLRGLEAYEYGLGANTTLILSTDSPLYRLLKSLD
jgi:modulator of FtsH protease HflC